jgi:hypothetical protein
VADQRVHDPVSSRYARMNPATDSRFSVGSKW